MFKIKNDLSPEIMTELFEQRNEHHYNLRNSVHFITPQIRTVYHGSESISFLGPKIWNILLDRLKKATSLEAFKIQIKSGNLKIVQVDCVGFTFKMSILYEKLP